MLRRELLCVVAGVGLSLASTGCQSLAVGRDEVRLDQDPRENTRRIRAAIQSAAAGSTVFLPPGRFEVELTQQSPFIEINRALAIEGAAGGTRLVPVSAGASYLEVFRVTADGVRLRQLTLQQADKTPTVLLNITRGSDLEIGNVTFLGPGRIPSKTFCHGIQLGLQNADHARIKIQSCVFSGLTSSTLVTNSSRSKLSDITMDRCRAENIDFNCPNATLSNLQIRNCRVDGSNATNFGIALAHVGSAEIVGTTILGTAWSGIHIEDYSSNIRVRGSVLQDCARGGANASGYVHVISGSRAIEVATTRFINSRRQYTLDTRSISVQAGGAGRTAGGRPVSPPEGVAIVANSFESQVSGPASVYLEGGEHHRVERNRFTGPRDAVPRTASDRSSSGMASVPLAGVTVSFGSDVLVRNNEFIGWQTGVRLQGLPLQLGTRLAERLKLLNRFEGCTTDVGTWQ